MDTKIEALIYDVKLRLDAINVEIQLQCKAREVLQEQMKVLQVINDNKDLK